MAQPDDILNTYGTMPGVTPGPRGRGKTYPMTKSLVDDAGSGDLQLPNSTPPLPRPRVR